jgi:hypothetical protein
LTEALVTKLVVEENGNITGVEFVHTGKSLKVQIKKEVILGAGTAKSAQSLGSSVLETQPFSVRLVYCIVDNASVGGVGQYLRDHSVMATGFELIGGELSHDILQDPAAAQKAFKEYGASRNGPMASSPQSASFASYASFGDGCGIRCAQEFDHL